MHQEQRLVFEVSWEVCNKVGGIYTVVKSKAAQMVAQYGDSYFLVGPYFPNKQSSEFSEEMPHDFCKDTIEQLRNEGIVCHFGKWLTEGSPNVILIDFEAWKQKTNDIKKDLWEWFKVDSLNGGYDYDEPVVWSYVVGRVVEQLATCQDKKTVAHFHEWLSGAGLLYLQQVNAKVATVFTTHATTLGRSLATAGKDLYNIWNNIDTDQEAKNLGVISKHSIEKQAAQNADIFTTVSEITSMEAEHMLGRKADVLVLNGLDIEKFSTFEEIAIQHKLQKERIKDFLRYYFYPYYDLDLNNSLIYFLAGRPEFQNKGIDVSIQALARLNEQLKNEKEHKNVIMFFFVPGNVRNIKPEILENKTYYQDIKDSIDEHKHEIEQTIVNSIISGEKISNEALFEKKLLLEMKGKVKRFKRKGNPPICTHDLNDDNDIILKSLQAAGLENKKTDPVKVIYYPIYLSGADHLLNLNYYETMQGAHFGMFPSYYEPWGYTPLEAGALGVSSVTTDLAGFGRFFCQECSQNKCPGIFILNRMNKDYHDVVSQLTEIMFSFQSLNKQERTHNKMQARKIAATADWKIFVDNYIQAHTLAVERAGI